jgi:hypothetical protein
MSSRISLYLNEFKKNRSAFNLEKATIISFCIIYLYITPVFIRFMKFLVRAKIPAEAGNKMVQDPNFLKNLEEYMNKVKPEAAYFMPQAGERSAAFIANIESNDQIPSLVEPLFQWMGANVEVFPVMNFDDLKKGLSKGR